MDRKHVPPTVQSPAPSETLEFIHSMLDDLRNLADDAGATFLHYLIGIAYFEASDLLTCAPLYLGAADTSKPMVGKCPSIGESDGDVPP